MQDEHRPRRLLNEWRANARMRRQHVSPLVVADDDAGSIELVGKAREDLDRMTNFGTGRHGDPVVHCFSDEFVQSGRASRVERIGGFSDHCDQQRCSALNSEVERTFLDLSRNFVEIGRNENTVSEIAEWASLAHVREAGLVDVDLAEVLPVLLGAHLRLWIDHEVSPLH